MPTLTVPKETLLEDWAVLDSLDGETDKIQVLRDTITDTGRWSIHHSLIFKLKETGKIYHTHYSVGATERQDERPWEYDDKVLLTEVEPYEKTIIDYRKIVD